MNNIKDDSHRDACASQRSEADSALPNTPRSPTQSSTEGDLVDSDRDVLGDENAPPVDDDNETGNRSD